MPIIGSIAGGSAGGFGQRKGQKIEYIIATGGTTVNSGDYTYHTFTGPGTLCVSAISNVCTSRNNICFMIVAGGGGGGNGHGGGGGGAGGYREFTAVELTAKSGYPVTVGGGGAAITPGSDSSFKCYTSTGGGNGGNPGGSGGSGGGAAGGPNSRSGGSGNTPPVSPPQGQPGGSYPGCVEYGSGAGGGGAISAGSTSFNGTPTSGAAGGNGSNNLAPWATITSTGDGGYYAGGGGGGAYGGSGGTGGAGGGGNGANPGEGVAPSGDANTGGGGGGSKACQPFPCRIGGAGGSGIVIIRYKYQN